MSETRSRTVSLPADIEKAVEDAVAAGEYATAEDAIASAIGEWKERRENWGYTIAELCAEIQKGIDSGPAEPFSMEDIKAEGRRVTERRTAAE